MKDNTVYVLATYKHGEDGLIRGVFTSKKMLKSGVDHWMKLFPSESLILHAYMKNYIPGNVGKEWAYISKTTLLGGIMDKVPRSVNLISITEHYPA